MRFNLLSGDFMFKINANFLEIKEQYLFAEIAKIKEAQAKENKKILDMSIGDVVLPLSQNVTEALHRAVDDLSKIDKFKGYSPSQGYLFLREAIRDKYKKLMNVEIGLDDIFVNDGAKSDLGNLLDIFSKDNVVGISGVCYPVYFDVCKIHGFKISKIKSSTKNNFLPMPEDIIGEKPNLIYLCSPNNPTGMAYNAEQLEKWVEFAVKNQIIIFYDSAYQDFIKQEDVPKTIYQIPGAKKCVLEVCSLSKSAGFTGIRCGYTIVPSEIRIKFLAHEVFLNKLWARRQATKFNGASYLSQRAAESFIKNPDEKYISHCEKNCKKIKKILDSRGLKYWGGVNSPYIWLECPKNFCSKTYFEYLIDRYGVVTTPGTGFGEDGEGFVRISTFFYYNI